tara:strand:+ start:439 stop:543 length:105 start_codon:yes stop_codon:yes gene_type:complete
MYLYYAQEEQALLVYIKYAIILKISQLAMKAEKV